MKPISLLKRLLFYAGFVLIVFIGTFIAILIRWNGYRYVAAFAGIFSVCLIPNYIFGLIFLKTKLIFKIIVPLITTSFCLGYICLMVKTNFYVLFDSLVWFIPMTFFPFAFVWEIAYQILKRKSKKEIKIE